MLMARASKIKEKKKTSTIPSTTEYVIFQRMRDDDSLIDFTEHRLVWMINQNNGMSKKKLLLIALLHDYRKGSVAIAWRSGEPVFLRMELTGPRPRVDIDEDDGDEPPKAA